MDRAKFAIATMIGLALVMSGYAWWFRKGIGDDAFRFWGRDAAMLIRNSPRVTLLYLEPIDVTVESASDEIELLRIERRVYAVTRAKCVSNAPGILNLRQALIEDASFAWDQQDGEEPLWAFGFRFESQVGNCTVLVDRMYQQVRLAGRSHAVSIRPISQGFKDLVSDQMADGLQ